MNLRGCTCGKAWGWNEVFATVVVTVFVGLLMIGVWDVLFHIGYQDEAKALRQQVQALRTDLPLACPTIPACPAVPACTEPSKRNKLFRWFK